MKKQILIFLMISWTYFCFGQQEIILTKYTINSLFFNPAYAGSTGPDEGSASLHYRNQWIGVEGAPSTMMLGAERSFFDHALGAGITLSNERIGANSNTEAALNTAYRVRINREGYMSGGIRAGFSYIASDFSKLNISDDGDVFGNNNDQVQLFTVGAGLMYHDETLQLGFSVPNIVSVGDGVIERKSHIYGHFAIKVGDDYTAIKWKPTLLVKYESAVPLQVTAGVVALLNDQFGIGAHWRAEESLALSVEYEWREKFGFALAYDFTTNDLNDYTVGSLELMAKTRF